jgi:hypothetical protein
MRRLRTAQTSFIGPSEARTAPEAHYTTSCPAGVDRARLRHLGVIHPRSTHGLIRSWRQNAILFIVNDGTANHNDEEPVMGQWQITVANQTLRLSYDGKSGQGFLVRLEDGLEASFSSPTCLPHLIEGILGQRAFLTNRDHIVHELSRVLPCASCA